jgi:alkanesulfonate monooxygenase SsuD/methylene tetrahydromethanopterin reductase-like flavin-dependent oxidoreductase (luciferase family)
VTDGGWSGRWIGYGGETNFHEGVLGPTVWAAGLLAHTRRIAVFSTVHTAFNSRPGAAERGAGAVADRSGGHRRGFYRRPVGPSPPSSPESIDRQLSS